jgi:NAD-specific glutamate dehydrogenase
VNKSSRTKSKIKDRAIIIHARRSSEHKSNFTFQVSIRRVYENVHRVSEDVTLQHRESKSMNKDMEKHSYLNHSRQKTEIIKVHILHPKASILHVKIERCRVLDHKGLVNEYLET